MGKASPQVTEDDEHQRVSGKVAAADVARAPGMVCVRLPSKNGSRHSKAWEVTATMGAVTGLGRQLMKDQVQMVMLEAASGYWRIFCYVLEMCGLAVQLVSPSQARNLKGRPETGKHDAMWLARLTGWGMLRPCFVPPAPIRELRDYTRARTGLVRERTRCWQRLEKLPEGALIKLSPVASKLTTQSAQDMIRAMIAGERDPRVLANMAQTRMRARPGALAGALAGMFDSHHGVLAGQLLDQAAFLGKQIETAGAGMTAALAKIPGSWGVDADGTTGPDAGHGPDAAVLPAAMRLAEIPGISVTMATAIIAGTGLDMTRFPAAAHLVSWAGLCRAASQPGPRSRPGKKGHGNAYPRSSLGQAAHRRIPHPHLPRRTVPADRPPARQGQGPGRRRPVHPGHHLAPAVRPRRPLRRPGPGLRRPPHRPGQENPQPRPRTPLDGTRGNPHPSRLTP